MMVLTYLLSPNKKVANERDRQTSKLLGEFLRRANVNFEILPWRIPPVSGMQDEQHYDINSKDLELEHKLASGNFIVLNTSGYAHSRTYFFEKALKQNRIHFGLDSHADLWNSHSERVGSDGFNASLLNLEGLEYCALMGVVPNQNLIPRGQSEEQIEKVLDKLNIYLMEDIEDLASSKEHWALEAYEKIREVFPKLKGHEFLGISPEINLLGKPAYVSVDLDVIQDFPTSWKGHGRLNANLLARFITRLGKRYRIVAGDICGLDSEYSPSSQEFNDLLKVYQSLRCAINPQARDIRVLNNLGNDEGN